MNCCGGRHDSEAATEQQTHGQARRHRRTSARESTRRGVDSPGRCRCAGQGRPLHRPPDLDITPAMRARIKVSAFTQGVTVADLLRGLLEREFPEHRRRTHHDCIRFACRWRGYGCTCRPACQRAADARGACLHRTTLQALPALRRTCAHAPARPLAPLRGVPAGRHVVPYPLAGQRLRHCALAAHGDAGLHAAGCSAAHPRRAAGARLLLHAEGENQVRAVLECIDAIEALGIAPAAVSPAYWRTLANRLAARLPLPEYTAERHAAWLTGRTLP